MAFQRIDEYPFNAKRNGCFGCGAPRRKEERLVQFDQMVDEITELDGTIHAASNVVLCETCIIELAVMMDLLTPIQAQRLRNENEQLQGRVREAEAALGTRQELDTLLMRLTDFAGDLAPSTDA